MAIVDFDRLFAPFQPPSTTLVDRLRYWTAELPEQTAFAFWTGDDEPETRISYAALDRQARALAVELTARGLRGERALLLYPPGLDFVAALFGCLYSGVIAVPAYPPRRNRNMERIEAISADAQAAIVLTTQEIAARPQSLLEQAPHLRQMAWLATDRLPHAIAAQWEQPTISRDALAVLQYTSGSTGDPKGVVLTHGNLLHNCELITHGFRPGRNGMGVIWLPTYHDMGLVGGIMEPVFAGVPSVLMPPLAFLQKPIRWLRGISRFRGTMSGGPNFAYALCNEKITPEQCAGLDLSSWEVAFNGAEPVRAETLEAFTRKFAPYGFRAEMHYPCYGLAETTLIVTGGKQESPPLVRAFDSRALDDHRAVPAAAKAPAVRRLVSSGRALPGEVVLIVDPETGQRLPDESVGEIWVSSPSVAQGYWNKPSETERAFGARLAGHEGRFLRTGDLGFLLEGELFVTGRCKDLIIIRGRNLYPHDVEQTVEQSQFALRLGGGACFSVEIGDEERLVVVHELDRQHAHADHPSVMAAIREAVLEEHEIPLYSVCLLRAGKLPKTSSGKVQRSACRLAYLRGELEAIAEWTDDVVPARREAPPLAVVGGDGKSALQIQNWLVAQLAARLRRTAGQVDIEEPFARFGLDSLALVELSGQLEEFLGRSISPTTLYSHPTIGELARHLAAPTSGAGEEHRERSSTDEPIAVVGLACRFPGASDPAAFWQLLREGRDAIGEVPASRWNAAALFNPDPAAAGGIYTRQGGFIEGVDQFDPQFFGIAPREAPAIDPQQRLLLEVAWETLENAGAAPEKLADSQVGVFVGISNCDYARLQPTRDLTRIDAYSGTGTAFSIAAGRLAYVLGVHGPCLAVDTACSSALVAVHLATQSLRRGECRAALAGGVNLLLDASSTAALCRLQALSRDGRCKTFDAAADGYGRGEGCGMVLLKRLSDAVADGDQIWAVVRGTAINHDGRSNGLTAPHGPSQEALIRAALADGRVEPAEVGYVEAHGTGTSLGDPIEMQALATVLGAGRDTAAPLSVGSVKTNIGHLEAAAGIAGLIKTVLALQHGEIPPHLHLQNPNPYIPWDQIPVRVPATLAPWPGGQRRRIAGVSSFGFSGTNAHIVLEESPQPQHAAVASSPSSELLVVSAKDEPALRELAGRFAARSGENGQDFADWCQTAALGRSHFAHRLAIVANSSAECVARLNDFAQHQRPAGLAHGRVDEQRRPKIAFLFTGQGAQFAGMARGLYASQPVFQRALDRCDAILREYLPRPLLEVLQGPDEPAALLDQTLYTQPALFAVEYALCELWQAWGVRPELALGHSIGEYVAACVLGVFSLEDALKLVAARSRLMQALPAAGGMVAAAADEATVRGLLSKLNGKYEGKVDVAAINSPRQTVLSGPSDALDDIAARLEAAGVRAGKLRVSHAFHSSLMEPMLDEFEALCRQVTFHKPAGEIASNVYGRLVTDEIANPEYWRAHVRSTVRFAEGLAALDARGVDVYLEIGPRPILTPAGRQCLADRGQLWLASLRPGREDQAQMLECAAELYARGVNLDWAGLYAHRPWHKASLPNYPFQRSRYWIDQPLSPGELSPVTERVAEAPPAVAPPASDHGLGEWLFEVQWQPRSRLGQNIPRRAADFIPSAAELQRAARPEIQRLTEQLRLPRYVELRTELDRLSAAYVWTALVNLGWDSRPDKAVTIAELAQSLAIAPGKERLLGRLVGMLAEDDLVRADAQAWRRGAAPEPPPPAELLAKLQAAYPECAAELTLFSSCAGNLAGVLQADIDPLQLLFPGGSTELVERLYRDSPFARSLNALLEETLARAIADLPPGRTLKILEIGAGTGGTAAHILPRLPAERTEYVFTDVSQVFTHSAAQKFCKYPFVRYGVLDIESDPAAQGFAAGQFDLVIAANVLHATRDLRQTLAHIRELLVPQGALVLLEGTRPVRWLDLIFGLTDGWWRFADDGVRESHPLISAEGWLRLFAEQGFAEGAVLPEAGDDAEQAPPQAVILARSDAFGSAQAGPRAPAAVVPSSRPPEWLILADRRGVGRALASALRAAGQSSARIHCGADFAATADRQFTVASGKELPRVLEALGLPQAAGLKGVVHLWGLDAAAAGELNVDRLAEAERLTGESAVEVLQSLIPFAAEGGPRVWLVTRGAQPVLAGAAVPGLAQSLLWGLGRIVADEQPALWGGLVDLDPDLSLPACASLLTAELLSRDTEDQVAYRRDQRYAARLVRRPLTTGTHQPLKWRTDASYLITGGFGDVGLRIAEWMVAQGAHHLVLCGRTPFPPREQWAELTRGQSRQSLQIKLVQSLEAQGATIRLATADVADEASLAAMLAGLRADGWPPLRGVVHAAGVPDAQPLTAIRPERMAEVLRPKVTGAWLLHEQLAGERLDFFVCCSSAAALFGSSLLGVYATANTFLDVLAHHRRAMGLPALSINWSFWEQTANISPTLAVIGPGIIPHGIHFFTTAQGLAALQHLLERGAVNTVLMPVDLREWRQHHPSAGRSSLLASLQMAEAQTAAPAADTAADPRAAILAAAPELRRGLAEDYLRQQISQVLQIPPARLDAHQSLNNLGIDSLMAVELRNHVQAHLGAMIPLAKLLQDPTVAQLADVVLQQLGEAPAPARPVTAPTTAPTTVAAMAAATTMAQTPAPLPTPSAAAVHPAETSNGSEAEATLARLGELSDAEVDAMLRQMLSEEQQQA